MATDGELLRGYSEEGSEEAFAVLTERYLPLVYAAAIRQVNGDEHLAKDVAQMVFAELARRAKSLRSCRGLSGWLYLNTRFAAAKAVRSDARRRVRESKAMTMNGLEPGEDLLWEELSPVLDGAMAELNAAHRTALLLRFFEGKDLKAVGAALGVSEDAARMRVQRGLEALRSVLARRGIVSAAGALALTLSTHALPAACPAGLAGSVSTGALALALKTGAEAGSWFSFLEFMATTKIKVAAATLLAAGIVTPYVVQQRALDRLKTENEQMRLQVGNTSAPALAAPASDGVDAEELARLRNEHQELLRLRGQVAALRRERDDLARQVAARGSARTNQPGTVPEKAVDLAWVQTMLAAPLAEQGSAAGSLRGKTMRREPLTAEEFALRDALSKQQLNQTLERSPAEFADFQAAFIQAAVGINDPVKIAQVHEIVRTTYEHAVAQGLDIPSKPTSGAEDWVQKRHELDRRATRALQDMLTPDEKRQFNHAFLGVMGIDLGTGVDKSNYPPGFLGK